MIKSNNASVLVDSSFGKELPTKNIDNPKGKPNINRNCIEITMNPIAKIATIMAQIDVGTQSGTSRLLEVSSSILKGPLPAAKRANP
jgi:hypothetical protein